MTTLTLQIAQKRLVITTCSYTADIPSQN